MSLFGIISREESERKLANLREENARKLAKVGERLKKLSVLFEKILCKLCESPIDIKIWKYINKHLSKEDAQYIVCSISMIFFCFF